ncbi:hypothetical protein ABTZ92_19510 [Streptomyces albidoflavus]|uniref:hypothetical protein n=1 Tax=Streptomyces albidoflavus TaxID=1886 RepID=UPI0033329ED3
MYRTRSSPGGTAALAALLVLALGGLTACGLARADEASDDQRVRGEVSSVRLDAVAGAVTLRGDRAATSVRVQRALRYQGERPEGATHRVQDGVLVLSGCGPDCSVAYTVDLPAGVPVSGSAGSGRVHLANVGTVDVSTTDGPVEVTGATGKVREAAVRKEVFDEPARTGGLLLRGAGGGPAWAAGRAGRGGGPPHARPGHGPAVRRRPQRPAHPRLRPRAARPASPRRSDGADGAAP